MSARADYSAVGPRLGALLAQRQADVDHAKSKRSPGSLTGAIGEAVKPPDFAPPCFTILRRPVDPG
jgi:indole-3-glycerol phosphate synthase